MGADPLLKNVCKHIDIVCECNGTLRLSFCATIHMIKATVDTCFNHEIVAAQLLSNECNRMLLTVIQY